MVGKRRGVSAKELRPFSVADPLGQGRPASGRVDHRAPLGSQRSSPGAQHSPSAQSLPPGGEGARPPAAAQMARVGCLVVMAVWGIGLLTSAAAWLPQLLNEVRPAIERLLERWELERQGATDPSSPAPPAQDDTPLPSGSAAPPGDVPSPAPEPVPGSAPDRTMTEVQRVCERTVACCLTVQGERARTLCENFRQLPVVEPCEQAYEAFAQVGRQLGRPCQE